MPANTFLRGGPCLSRTKTFESRGEDVVFPRRGIARLQLMKSRSRLNVADQARSSSKGNFSRKFAWNAEEKELVCSSFSDNTEEFVIARGFDSVTAVNIMYNIQAKALGSRVGNVDRRGNFLALEKFVILLSHCAIIRTMQEDNTFNRVSI